MKRASLLGIMLLVTGCWLVWPIPSQAQIWKRLQQKAEEAAKQKAEEKAAEEAEEAMAGDSDDGIADFRKLKALLPEEAAGLPRVRAEGSKGGAFGIRTSKAEAFYEEGDRSLHIEIVDPGTLQGFAALGYSWMQQDIDQEDEDGYERTLTLDGRRAYEKVTRYDGTIEAELSTVVADRFVVSLEGTNVPPEALREVLRSMDLAVLEEMAKELGEAKAELTDFRVLKEMLPESIDGLKRVEASGERSSAMGIQISQASATYRDGDREVRVKISDMGSMQQIMGFAAAWMRQEIDRENERGYERTTRYQGHPAYEKMERLDDGTTHATLQVVVRDRYMIELEGTNVSMDVLRSALEQIDLSRLEGEG
ncbi:hypothetical protein [Rhodothermus marinus]|uniref:hypothetical protein n=1 Tax=Rhodothermus marinus TaxID=29549 RepID=UPI0012BA3C56|nr:hypothetical protein [Rhodothermus marinus]BBM69463.1 hypothetical protein RmaAA213_13090 [Rhodothermus marinus]BBM72445.1 hypothetical protein RmaAA338_13100 [Rhodothermus marinus]